MALIKRENLNVRVYEILKEMIMNARFEPGARINVEKLTKEIGTSRTPIWEAIRRLEQEGLVVHYAGKGTFMSSLTPREALDIYAVREVLEGMAAREAAERIDEDTLKKMEKCLAKQLKIVEKQDVVNYSQNDFEFHAYIYEASGNDFLREELEGIKNKMRPLGIHFEENLHQFFDDHQEVIEALRNRDGIQAEEALRKHNQHMMEIIRGKISSEQQE